ncbi:MAG: SRPBCC domain-containing protein [Myxococcota bacterium]
MTNADLSITMTVDAEPNRVFEAIVDVGSWWSGTIDGTADRVGAEFRYRYADLHDSTQRVVDHVPGRRVAWRVTHAHLSFVDKPDEWRETELVFELEPRGSGTYLRFTHSGLRPSFGCYEACSGGWATLLTRNLRARIVSGVPQPDAFEAASHG